jgi:hypothetical protein
VDGRVRYRRTGGFAGTTLTSEAGLDELPPELRALLERTDLHATGGPPPQGADRFQHELIVDGADGEQRAVLGDHETGELKPLLDWLVTRARQR